METTETDTVLATTTSELVKDAAIKAAAGAIVAVAVTQLATYAVNKIVEKYQDRKAIKAAITTVV